MFGQRALRAPIRRFIFLRYSNLSWHPDCFIFYMTEKICIAEKEIAITIEPHVIQPNAEDAPAEYFTAGYSVEHTDGLPGFVLFTQDGSLAPKRFKSPVEALEYATEKLSDIL